jgi:hypothetical protein
MRPPTQDGASGPLVKQRGLVKIEHITGTLLVRADTNEAARMWVHAIGRSAMGGQAAAIDQVRFGGGLTRIRGTARCGVGPLSLCTPPIVRETAKNHHLLLCYQAPPPLNCAPKPS